MSRVVLCYSGGLDTTVCIPLLKERYGFREVVTVTVNVGQPEEELRKAEERGRRYADRHYTIDAVNEFVDMLFMLIKANGDYEGYVLGTALARPLIARKIVEIAIKENEDAGTPVVTKKVVILPVVSLHYGKIYLLWRGTNKLYEYEYAGEENYMPKVSAAYGNIYAVFSYDRAKHAIIKFEDSEKPEIKKVENIKHNNSIDVRAMVQDKESGIYKAIVAYNKDSEWHYVEMEPVRRYVMEPIGGYGFNSVGGKSP